MQYDFEVPDGTDLENLEIDHTGEGLQRKTDGWRVPSEYLGSEERIDEKLA